MPRIDTRVSETVTEYPLTVTSTGSIDVADDVAVRLQSFRNDVPVVNRGSIHSDFTIGILGLVSEATLSIENYGTISAPNVGISLEDYASGGATFTLLNRGTITGTGAGFDYAVLSEASRNTITNTGELRGAVGTEGRDDTIVNRGEIRGALSTGGTNATVENHGSITGVVAIADGTLVNTGELARAVSVGDVLRNSGTIDGLVEMTDAIRTELVNSRGGTIASYEANGQVNDVENRGEIGFVRFGDGNDGYTGRGEGFVRGVVAGGGGLDVLKGGTLADRFKGEAGDDFLTGGAGADVLNGGQGDDVLTGGRDADVLQGGLGDDIFVATRRGGHDQVLDFRDGDRLEVAAFGLSGFDDPKLEIRTEDGHTIVDLGSAVFELVRPVDLTADDFIF